MKEKLDSVEGDENDAGGDNALYDAGSWVSKVRDGDERTERSGERR